MLLTRLEGELLTQQVFDPLVQYRCPRGLNCCRYLWSPRSISRRWHAADHSFLVM